MGVSVLIDLGRPGCDVAIGSHVVPGWRTCFFATQMEVLYSWIPGNGETKAASCDDSVLLTKSQDLRLWVYILSWIPHCGSAKQIVEEQWGPKHQRQSVIQNGHFLVSRNWKSGWNLKRSCLCCDTALDGGVPGDIPWASQVLQPGALGGFTTGDNGHLLAKLDGPQLRTCWTSKDAGTSTVTSHIQKT